MVVNKPARGTSTVLSTSTPTPTPAFWGLVTIGTLEITGPDADGDLLLELPDEARVWLSRANTITLAQDLADRLGLSLIDPATGVRALP